METDLRSYRRKLRDAHITLAEQFEPNAFVTLTTNDTGCIAEMTRLVGKFCGMLDRKLLGQKFHKLPPEERTDGMFFIEHTASNIHAHGILRIATLDKLDLPSQSIFIWNRLTKSGSVDFKLIYDARRCAAYCTKEMCDFSFSTDQVVPVRMFMNN